MEVEPDECAICYEPMKDLAHMLHLPPCGHSFHGECILRWLRSKPQCPLCRETSYIAEPLHLQGMDWVDLMYDPDYVPYDSDATQSLGDPVDPDSDVVIFEDDPDCMVVDSDCFITGYRLV